MMDPDQLSVQHDGTCQLMGSLAGMSAIGPSETRRAPLVARQPSRVLRTSSRSARSRLVRDVGCSVSRPQGREMRGALQFGGTRTIRANIPCRNQRCEPVCRRIRGEHHPSPSIAVDQEKPPSASDASLPKFLRTRSVDQVGRKSETTLRIASLHFEISTFSGTATDQLKLPSGASAARYRQRG